MTLLSFEQAIINCVVIHLHGLASPLCQRLHIPIGYSVALMHTTIDEWVSEWMGKWIFKCSALNF